MRLTRDVALVGGGDNGFNISAPLDCHVYLLDGGDELALVDAGVGHRTGNTGQILDNIRADGYDPGDISRLLLTHYHADHAGGAAEVHDELGVTVHGSPLTAMALETGDAEAISLNVAKTSGFYPEDYVFRPCPATGDLVEGVSFKVGQLTVTPYDTPGHCRGHMSLLVESDERRYLIGGDLVFWGGTIVAQNIPDCSIQEYSASTQKMERIDFDALLPGHFAISLQDGKRHIDRAAAAFRRLMIPRNAI